MQPPVPPCGDSIARQKHYFCWHYGEPQNQNCFCKILSGPLYVGNLRINNSVRIYSQFETTSCLDSQYPITEASPISASILGVLMRLFLAVAVLLPMVTTRTYAGRVQLGQLEIEFMPVALYCYTIARNLLRDC
jgi:hypothetical protein